MKKIIVLAAILLSGITVSAQEFSINVDKKDSPVHCKLGVTAGADVSTISTGNDVSLGYCPGLNAGLVFNIRFLSRNEHSNAETGYLAIQPEFKFATMGAKKLQTSYLMVPVMFQVYPTKNFYIELGPEFCMNISHNTDYLEIDDYTTVDLENLKANDLMLGAGLGYYLTKGLSISGRYNFGTSKIAGNLPWKNSMVQINLSYTFSLKKKNSSPIDFDF